jgi:hypothetical protein
MEHQLVEEPIDGVVVQLHAYSRLPPDNVEGNQQQASQAAEGLNMLRGYGCGRH